ncbi:MAG: ATP-dependent DNA helicase RecG [Bacilli bacterium]|nr:ATP-dependent DNA helicase RecG [Bacilli bacterium]
MNIEVLKGVGATTKNILNELGIYTINDLVNYYPFRYNVYNLIDITNDIDESLQISIKAKVESNANVFYIKKNFNRLTFKAVNNNRVFNVTIFNRAFLKKNITIGRDIILIGKYNPKKNTFVASDIKFKDFDKIKIEPVYHLINGLKYANLCKYIDEALHMELKVDEYIPTYLLEKYKFIDKYTAIKEIHKPSNINILKQAKLHLIYEELFTFMFKVQMLKNNKQKILKPVKNIDIEKVNNLITNLPFKLTTDQLKCVDDIISDLKSDKRMNRIVIGDVGSGKTIVGQIAMYACFLAGYQSAMMAPTEVLATQHYNNLKNIFKDYDINIALLTGSMTKKEKNTVIEKLKNKEIDLIVGTHALFTDNVEFSCLGLVITDEQHRFGVLQRTMLHNKGENVDILYMSATPIPRTYALTIYGDLDVSTIKTKPAGRKEVITTIYNNSQIKDVLHQIYEEIKLNHQIYVVSPIIENNEELDLKGVEELKNKFLLAFNNKINVEILHSRMSNDEKDKILNDFKNNKINILVSTTVIEVGVDVANATMMVIFNAERFGLSTLHQLRGRVGRSNLQSYCSLITDKDNDKTKERLTCLTESNDGFYISEKDFELRGHGDLFGVKQSGEMHFNMADLNRDYKILLQAKEDSKEFIEKKYYQDYKIYDKILKDIEFID